MRLMFATTNLSMPRDLAKGYAGVEVIGVHTSYGGLLRSMLRENASAAIAMPDALVLSDDLRNAADRGGGLTVEVVVAALRRAYPNLRIILVGRTSRIEEQAIRLGAERFIEQDERASAVNLAAMLRISAKSEVARIIAITGHQGGAGRTTIAQGIAEGLADLVSTSASRGGVLLWELDLEHPTLGFNQEVDLISADHGRRTISRILNGDPIEGDEDLPRIRESIVSKEKSRLDYDVLLAPHGIREVMALYQSYPHLIDLRERLDSIMGVLARHYQAIVVDLGTNLIGDPGAAVALRDASHIVTVATPSASGLRSVMTMRAIITDLHAEERSKLVLNRTKRAGDDAYTRYMTTYAQGVFETIANIAEGAPPNAFTVLASRVIGVES